MNQAREGTTHERLDRMRRTPADLAALVEGPQRHIVDQRPGPNAWSATEVLCHLLDIEEAYFDRIRFILANEEPAIIQVDPDRWVNERQYQRHDPLQTISAFRVRRGETLNLLDSLDAALWERGGMHPSRGRLTIRRITHSLAKHDSEHFEQMARALAGRP